MESSFGPNSTDEPSLLYKLQRKIKVFNTNNPLPNRGYNLVTSSSKYGLVFIGSPDGVLTVYHLKDLIDKDCEPLHATVKLHESPTHIAVSCDQELLAVTGGQLLSIYSIADFQNPNPPSTDIRIDTASSFVSGLQWNPIIPDNLAIVFYNGSLLVANIGTSQVKIVPSKARCLCWSPKGKQLVTGNNDGTLTQYKPDLTPAKNIPAPNLFEGGAPTEALAVYWISTFMFAVVFKNAADNSRPVVTIVNTPKGSPGHCLNYEDVCYSMGPNRPWYYYLQGIPQWCIIMASSSNSMEIATLGSKNNGEVWVQWCQSDEARPELPLTDKKIENFPIGICIDTCAIHQLPYGENSVLPYMPLLHVLSHNGLLTIFNVINLNKDAPQICAPPQQLILPAAAMTSVIPGDVPTPTQPAPAPAPVQTKPQIPPVQVTSTPQQQSVAPPPQYNPSEINIPKPQSFHSYTDSDRRFQTSVPVQAEQKQTSEAKPTPVSLPKAAAPSTTQAPQPMAPKPQTPQQAQENAALKAEQERISEMKANQELKDMLVKEVNDFQMELHKFLVKARETQAKLKRDMESINTNFKFNVDSEQLKKECSLEDMRGAIVQLKLELVRACAVVAEARTHAEVKDYPQWTQTDPLTTKRVASVKKLAYYVQNQLEQAQKALDYKWSEVIARNPNYNKSGQRMIRPILDDVYQPLVKQQEILSRQEAVLRTLRNTFKECDVMPIFKSTSLLRSTPFRNKDPLSKLTKNILNMSIEPEKTKQPLLSAQKLDALRDMLSNHKTVKIKPVKVEMRQQLATMKLNYEKSLREKAVAVKSESLAPSQVNHVTGQQKPTVSPYVEVKMEPKIEPKQEPTPSPINIPSFTPVGGIKPSAPGLTNVARTLFSDEPKPKPIQVPQPTQPKPSAFAPQYSPITPVTPVTSASPVNTHSVLKDLLQNKQTSLEAKAMEAKNDANTFMGQKICSPSSFAFSATTTTTATTSATRTTAFAAKPTSNINIFNKFQPQAFAPETKSVQEIKPQAFDPKPQAFVQESKSIGLIQEPKPQIPVVSNTKSSETGEPEATETKTVPLKPKTDKPITHLFGMKTTTPLAGSNVPDVLKMTQDVPKAETKTASKPVEKENLPEKTETKVLQKPEAEKKETAKPLTVQTNKTSIFGSAPQAVISSSSSPSSIESTPTESKTEVKVDTEKVMEKPVTPTSSASSIFAAGNATVPSASKPTPLTLTSKSDAVTSKPEPVTTASTPTETAPSSKPSIFSLTPTSSAASVFGAAVASQPKNVSQASSIFAMPSSPTPSSVFGSATQGSIFGSTQASVFASATQPASTTATSKPSIFSSESADSPTEELTPPVFGSTETTSQPGSIFGSSAFATSTTTQAATSVFGSPSSSVFAPTTTQASVFDATTSAPSVFSSTPTTTQASIFSSMGTTSTPSAFTPTATQASVFGSSTATTKSSVFGTSGGSVFASATPNSNTSVFGVHAASTQPSSVFGAATMTTQASVFGTPTATTQASVFGSAIQSSVFGTPEATNAQSNSLFGGGEANLFAAASISTTSAPSPTSGGSIFGGSSSGSVFGSSTTNVFGSKTGFGQPNPTAASIFGGGGATSFGQKPASNFWSGGSGNAEGGFGSPSGGFGQQATTQASSIFGGTTGGSFSTPAPAGQPFGSPQSGVFSSPQQQTGAAASAFGGSPVFGGNQSVFGSSASFGSPSGGFGSGFGGGFNKSPSSGFGAPAAFGGGATFGGGAAFGSTSPGKVFGGAAPVPAFSSTQSNATFESLATQNTLTFGNLAQQSGQPQPQAPSFNTSPSFTGWRG